MKQTWLVVAFLLALVPSPIQAQEIDSQAVERAKNYIKPVAEGQFIAGFLHFGVRYDSHTYAKLLTVENGGRKVPGHFALVYDFACSDNVRTQAAFLCDARGNLYKVQILSSNGVFQQPFALANASIKLLGEAVFEALKDNLTDGDRRALRGLINDADAQGLMTFALRVRQANR